MPLAPVTLLKPVLTAALGVDGGAIFQLLATQDLGLPGWAIGAAFGLGLLSLPAQLWAARIPFRCAVRNLQAFFVVAAAQSLTLAWLVGTQARGNLAAIALAVTIAAEVAVSVLFVTAWQPLLSQRLSPADRQRLNAGTAAAGKMTLAALLLAFSACGPMGRTGLLCLVAVAACWVAWLLRTVSVGDGCGHEPDDGDVSPSSASSPPASAPWSRLVGVLLTLSALNLGALPVWLVYLAQVAWPSAPLGAIAAAQTVAAVVALLAWRPTTGSLGRPALAGVGALLVGVMALLAAGPVARTHSQQALLVLASVAITLGVTYTSIAVLEIAHRLVTSQAHVVRVFTVIDVVDSSSLQLGLLIGGILTTPADDAAVTPYVAFVAVANLIAALATAHTARVTGVPGHSSRLK